MRPSQSGRHRLLALTGLLAVLTLVHDADHVRQARALPAILYLVAVGAVLSLATTAIVIHRYPQWARLAAAVQGMVTVAGVGAVHAAPQWSSYTDSYAAADADALSWAIIVAMMLTGVALTAASARRDH